MKKIIIALALVFSVSLTAKEVHWFTNYDQAIAEAKAKNRSLILVFQGSDWCVPCMKLDRKIWSTEEFATYAKDNFVMLKADFPKRKKNKLPEEQQKHNDALFEKYNTRGIFPFVVVIDTEGKVKGTTGYKKMSPKKYIDLLNAF